MQYLTQTSKFTENLAKFISVITNASLVTIPVFGLINYFLLDWSDFLSVTFICILFAALIPIIVSVMWIESKKIEMDMPNRKDRSYPLLFTVISYFIGFIVLYLVKAPPITTILMFCYFSNTTIVFFINLFWKISIHSMGVAGPTTALIYVFGYSGLIFGLIVPLVMWSRVYLKRHTLLQVIMGAFFGFVLTTVQIHFLIGYWQ